MKPLEYLNSFTNFETQLHKLKGQDFELSRVVELLGYLGDPQKKLKVIHVAGTKGKGSTCAFISHMLVAAGFKAGLYTSPHLHQVNERIRILDKDALTSKDDFYGMITDDQLMHAINDLRPHIAGLVNRGMTFTYFEVLTVAALQFFSKQNLDFVVLETGLGGRLDATNACESMLAVITPISLDHTKILGKTIEAIAFEKAGIIKNCRQKAVLAPQVPAVMDVLMKRCREFGIVPVVCEPKELNDLQVSLKGEHQKINALTALRAVELLKVFGVKINEELIKYALKHTRWAGRFEVLQKDPLVIVDGAHNEASAKALVETVKQEYPKRKIILVLGISSDKDVKALAREFKEAADTIILTKADHPRAYAFSKTEAEQLFKGKTYFMTARVPDALEMALSKASPHDVVVATGSIFTVAEIRDSYVSAPIAR